MTPMWWGAMIGAGLAVTRHAWTPPTPSLQWRLRRLHEPRDPTGPVHVGALQRSSWWRPDPTDLAVTGRDDASFAFQIVVMPLALVAVVVTWWIALVWLGLSASSTVWVVAVLGAAAVGLVLPGALLRREAHRRRLAFGHALSAFLDLVSVLLAGGAGLETSLTAAADAGDGWAFSLLRNELVRARARRRSPWDGFAELGRRLGVGELVDLAATIQLAGTHGARVRQSLTARAAAVRDQHLAQVEADAQAATERMGLPMVLVFIGFVALLGYPALTSILGGL